MWNIIPDYGTVVHRMYGIYSPLQSGGGVCYHNIFMYSFNVNLHEIREH